VIAVTHFRTDDPQFAERATELLALLAARPGYRGGALARSTDDAGHWLLSTRWVDVGSYRRAFSADLRPLAIPLMSTALDLPGGFEELVTIDAEQHRTNHGSDLAGR
jgi:hypothetical protein